MFFALYSNACGDTLCAMSLYGCWWVRITRSYYSLLPYSYFILSEMNDYWPIPAFFSFLILQNVREQLPESLPGTGGGGNPNDNFLVKFLLLLPFCALFFCYYRSLLQVCHWKFFRLKFYTKWTIIIRSIDMVVFAAVTGIL